MADAGDYAKKLSNERMRDRQFGSTRRGPHRDDFEFLINSKDARTFASEGQQRGMVLGLRLAEFDYLLQATKRVPLILADDVLGELDHQRKTNFWNAVGSDVQVIATGTEVPEKENRNEWQVFEVENGNFSLKEPK